MDYKRKGDRLIISQRELREYLDQKLLDLGMFMSNVITALFIVSVMAVILIFKADDVYLYAVILLPLIARGYVYTRIEKNLHKRFAELLEL